MDEIEVVSLCESYAAGALESVRRIYPGNTTSLLHVFSIEGFNDSATTLYLQIFAGVEAPAPGAVPRYVLRVPQGSFSWRPLGGYAIGAAGGMLVASTTPAIYTAPVTPSCWWRVLYLPEMRSPTFEQY